MDEGSFGEVKKAVLSLPQPAQETVMTIAEWLEKKGRDEGQRDGALRELREAVRHVLGRRGLAVSPEQDAAIEACLDLVQLRRWLDEAIVATSAQEALREA